LAAVVGCAKHSASACWSADRTLTANEYEPAMATCVSLRRPIEARRSGGSTLTEAMALAVIPARSGPWRAATTDTPVAKRAIIARRWRRSSSPIGSEASSS
jgi:hypothetical protein